MQLKNLKYPKSFLIRNAITRSPSMVIDGAHWNLQDKVASNSGLLHLVLDKSLWYLDPTTRWQSRI
jgi:hypothetical protein